MKVKMIIPTRVGNLSFVHNITTLISALKHHIVVEGDYFEKVVNSMYLAPVGNWILA